MEDSKHIAALILSQLKGELDEPGTKVLNDWISQSGNNKALYERLTDPETLQTEVMDFYRTKTNIFSKIQNALPAPRVISMWRRIAVAASVLLLISAGSYFIFFNKPAKQTDIVKREGERFKNDVEPGKQKAKLTLADGTEIILDSAATGELAKQGKTIVLNKNGQLIYQPAGNMDAVLYNILSTAKGETYAMVLADGSKVWLNAGSSIRYPTSFTGHERSVEITGEAYFEVAKDVNKKFFVTGNGVTTEVLGTHFNVNAYTDEAMINVTLLEGSVKVSKGSATGLLSPGQQAQVADDIRIASNINVEEVMAWKNGRFSFRSADIKTVMRQLERWYDIEVTYTDQISLRFTGEMRRDTKLSEMLRAIEVTGNVKFAIDGKVVSVMKK